MAEIGNPSATNSNDTIDIEKVMEAVRSDNLAWLRDCVEKTGYSFTKANAQGWFPLEWAAIKGSPEIVKYIIDHGGDVNAQDKLGFKPLHNAARRGNIAAADVLLQNGASLEDLNSYDTKPLAYAIRYGHITFLEHMMAEHTVEIDSPDDDGMTLLHWAAKCGKTDIVKLLLSKGAGFDITDNEGFTAMTLALKQGYDETYAVLSFLEGPLQVNSNSNDTIDIEEVIKAVKSGNLAWLRDCVEKTGYTFTEADCRSRFPLHHAAKKSSPEIVKYIIDHGGDVKSQDKYGYTPLHDAASYGNIAVADVLLQNGASLEDLSNRVRKPLAYAIQKGHITFLKHMMAEQIVEIDSHDGHGRTLLHWAAEYGKTDVVKLLLSKGAGYDIHDNYGFTPMKYALRKGYDETYAVLLSFWVEGVAHAVLSGNLEWLCDNVENEGYTFTSADREGYLPLQNAARNGSPEIVKYIIDHGGDVKAQGNIGLTPLHVAALYGNIEAADVLLQKGASLDAVALDGTKPLSKAIIEDNIAFLNHFLMERPGLIDSTDSHGKTLQFFSGKGKTLLHWASQCGKTDIVQLLIDIKKKQGKGLDVYMNSLDGKGLAPLHHTCIYGKMDTADVLLQNGASLDVLSSQRTKPLSHAVVNGNISMLNRIISDHNVEINSLDGRGMTLLHWAAKSTKTEIIKLLLSKGASLDIKDKDGLTVMQRSIKESHNDVIVALLSAITAKEMNVDEMRIEMYKGPFEERSKFITFEPAHIRHATDSFSQSARLGGGGFGSVYKGLIKDKLVAIKVLDTEGRQGDGEFLQEIVVLQQVDHPNLVRLLGACLDLRSLVYEYIPKGSLEHCLTKTPRLLTWQIRVRIVHEICSGLSYIHSLTPKALVHGDLKPDNVLINDNFSSKLADFGLCRFQTSASQVTGVRGTRGYLDPAFFDSGNMTPLCDIYSLGITMLRVLTGKDVIGNEIHVGVRKMVLKVRNTAGNLMEIVDNTAGEWPTAVAELLADYGLMCSNRTPEKRPKLTVLLNELEKILSDISN